MITFIKDYNLGTIKKKLILLYILNITDLIFTVVLLKTGYYKEINILMVDAVQNPLASIILKILLPALLLFYLYKRVYVDNDSYHKATNIGINISIIIYTLVNLSHLLWTALFLSFHLLII